MTFILKHKKLFGLLFWLWIIAIIYFTLTPNSLEMKITLNNKIIRLDYLFHFLVYFSLSLLFLLWKANEYFRIKINFLIYFLIGSFILAGGSEFAQSFVPGRTFNLLDLVSNMLGIAIGMVCIIYFIPEKVLQTKKIY